MPKRFTETEKWRDSWFRRLSPKLKCLWQYIWDTCDAAGVFDVDFDQASFVIGGKVTPGDLAVFDGRLGNVNGSRFVILEFIPFQYGRLTETCPAHKPVLAAMNRHGLAYAYPSDRVMVGIQPSSDTSTIPTRQDKSKTREEGFGESERKGLDSIAAFEQFWQAYPNKVARMDAEHAFVEVGATAILATILAAVEAQKAGEQWTKDRGKFIPKPSSWLRDGRWSDVPRRSGAEGREREEHLTAPTIKI